MYPKAILDEMAFCIGGRMTVREKTITTALIGALNRMGVGTVVLEPHELLNTDLRIRIQRNGSMAVSLEGEQRCAAQ